MTRRELDVLYRRLEELSALLADAEFKNAEKTFGEYFKACADFLEGLAAFLEEDKNNRNLTVFLNTYGKLGKGHKAIFRPITKYEAENFSEKHDLLRLHEGYEKLKLILEDKQKNDRFDRYSNLIQSFLEFLKLNIEVPMQSNVLSFLGLLFGQDQKKTSRSHLETEQADFAAFVREQKETLSAQLSGLTDRYRELVEAHEEQKKAWDAQLQAYEEAYKIQSQGHEEAYKIQSQGHEEAYKIRSQGYEEAYKIQSQGHEEAYNAQIDQHQELFEKHEQNMRDHEQKAQELENKIEALLPGAGTVGLAESYFEAKRKYGYVPYHEMFKKSEDTHDRGSSGNVKERGRRVVNHVMSSSPHLVDFVFFMGPLIAIFLVNRDIDAPTGFYDLLGLVAKNIGLVIIALFGLQSIGRKRSLYEEYNHKQRVMTLFTAFKKEMGEDPEQKKELFKMALETVSEKPKSIYYDIEKKSFLDKLLGTRSKNDSKSEKPSTDASPSKPGDTN